MRRHEGRAQHVLPVGRIGRGHVISAAARTGRIIVTDRAGHAVWSRRPPCRLAAGHERAGAALCARRAWNRLRYRGRVVWSGATRARRRRLRAGTRGCLACDLRRRATAAARAGRASRRGCGPGPARRGRGRAGLEWSRRLRRSDPLDALSRTALSLTAPFPSRTALRVSIQPPGPTPRRPSSFAHFTRAPAVKAAPMM